METWATRVPFGEQQQPQLERWSHQYPITCVASGLWSELSRKKIHRLRILGTKYIVIVIPCLQSESIRPSFHLKEQQQSLLQDPLPSPLSDDALPPRWMLCQTVKRARSQIRHRCEPRRSRGESIQIICFSPSSLPSALTISFSDEKFLHSWQSMEVQSLNETRALRQLLCTRRVDGN